MEVTVIRSALHWTRSFVVLVPLVLGCSGSSQKDAETPNDGLGGGGNDVVREDDANAPKWSSKPSNATGNSGESGDSGGLNKEQKEQMEIVLKRGAKKAENCSASVPDGKGGEGEVKVTFDGQKGRITDVTVGAPWAGTSMESCLKRAWVGEIVLPFEGEQLEVPYSVKIPEKAGGAPATTDKPATGKKK
jgi:hypothetical protein